ncbi:MAG TPA: HAMP domain-containing sensor histidine kinase [Minicystis sp.]|nr:HAMP domain-containing sensor histidine kinase [Minicystis sp.]
MPRVAEPAFLGRVGHDLRGELATMVAGVHYLLRYDADLGATAKQMLERVNGAGQRMKRLLDEFDNAAWIDGGDPAQLMMGRCAAPEIVAAALERLAPQAEAREVEVVSSVPASLPAFEGDGELVGVALEYVIDFAVARSSGRKVSVVGTAEPGVVVTVLDEGGPVDPDVVARLFEPFVEKEILPRQTAGGAKRRERLGLGLAIAAGILRSQRGELAVKPTADGLAFACVMPRAS